MAIPFAVEIRCLLDFNFSKTALDHFQYFQLFGYHVELYMAKWNNKYYMREKVFGREVIIDDRVLGWIFSFIFFGLMVGPFIFFSEMGGFIQTNPVQSAQIEIGFTVNKTVSRYELINEAYDIYNAINVE